MSSGATPFAILAWLGTIVLHGTLLMVAALALGRRVRSLWLRERILRTAFFGAFLTATLSVAGFEPLLGRIPLARPVHSAGALSGSPAAAFDSDRARTARSEALSAMSAAESDEAHVAGTVPPGVGAERFERPALASEAPAATRPNRMQRPVLTKSDVAWLALGAWGLWCALAWGRTAHGLLRLHRSLRDRVRVQGPIAADLAALRRRARVHQPVRLSVSESASVPVTLGLFRREICLPRRALDTFTRTELCAILAHELAHTKRRDTVWFLAYALVERAFAFQPLQRRVRRELLATAELDCDDLAVGWTGAGLELASSLTEIARWIVAAGGRRLPVPTMAHDGSRLGRRVTRLLEAEALCARREHWALVSLGALLALGGTCAVAPALCAAARPERSPFGDGLEPARLAVVSPADEEGLLDAADEAPAPAAIEPPAAGPPPSARVPYALQLDQELFGSEMQLLDDELGLLRAEVERLDQPYLAQAMEDIDRRVQGLALRRQRMNELLERVFGGEPPDVGGAPRADVPPESP